MSCKRELFVKLIYLFKEYANIHTKAFTQVITMNIIAGEKEEEEERRREKTS
jgi:hypothetical protein